MDTYGEAIVTAVDAARKIAGSDSAHVMASCSGGIVAAMVASHLADIGAADRLATLALVVTVLDQSQAGFPAVGLDKRAARAAVGLSARKGYLDGRALAELFAWMRPTDLVWRYWINNYLQGRSPAPFDVLFWNADTTRMAAALHRDMVSMGLNNALTKPGEVTMLGTPVDLSNVMTDLYVIGGVSDHISPWQATYRSARLVGSKHQRYLLSTSGHIAALVNPPGNPKLSYRFGSTDEPDPAQWFASAQTAQGSWWPDYAGWLAERGGAQKPAPHQLGADDLPPLGPAPGTYVHET